MLKGAGYIDLTIEADIDAFAGVEAGITPGG